MCLSDKDTILSRLLSTTKKEGDEEEITRKAIVGRDGNGLDLDQVDWKLDP
jgi:hypothetical protein